MKLHLKVLVVMLLTLLLLSNINSSCESCKDNGTPCLRFISAGIEKYCSKQADTSQCYCDWI